MTDRDAFSLIFMPGFSTAEKVTSVSVVAWHGRCTYQYPKVKKELLKLTPKLVPVQPLLLNYHSLAIIRFAGTRSLRNLRIAAQLLSWK